jgi:hypothetical protein
MDKPEETKLLIPQDEENDIIPSKSSSLIPKVVVALALLSAVAITGVKMSSSTQSNVNPSLAATMNPIDVLIENEYDNYDAMKKYPFLNTGDSFLIEPYRTSTLSIPSPVSSATYSWNVGTSLKDSLKTSDLSEEYETYEGENIEILRESTGAYSLILTETINNEITRTSTFTLYCKYVRRELRSLTLEDRESYLKAASTLWKTSTKEGRNVFGYSDSYRDIHSIAIIHNDLAANVICDHLHGTSGYFFLNGHVALNNMLEQSIQAVDPSVSLPYWDYSQEKNNCDKSESSSDCIFSIWDSEMFTADFFGSKGDQGQINDGYWANIQVPEINDVFFESSMIEGHYREHSYAGCYGQDNDSDSPNEKEGGNGGCNTVQRSRFKQTGGNDEFLKYADKHVMNSYNLLRSPWNMNGDKHVIRSGDMCGMKNDEQWPDCMAITSQQEKYNTFKEWVLNVQFSPHGSTHLFIGGAFGECSETYPKLNEFLSEPTFTRFVSKSADMMKNMYWYEYITCPSRSACTDGQDCSCSCPSIEGLTEDSITHEFLENNEAYQYLFTYLSPDMKKEVQALSAENKFKLLTTVCESSVMLGDMLASSSAMDVSFFNIHAEVERMWQRKALSGTMTDLTWNYPEGFSRDNPACPSSTPGYKMVWMDYIFNKKGKTKQNIVSDSKLLRNDEFLKFLTPSSSEYAESMPYVYDKFTWDTCSLPSKYENYDTSLMDANAWIKPESLDWLNALQQ